MTSGIYRITCLVNSKFYIGSSSNIEKRWISHRTKLNNRIHVNPHLQNSWNKHGMQSFSFEILELCPEEELIPCEQYYIDNLKPEFNIRIIAESNLGFRHSDETKLKMSKTRTGTSHSEDWNKKISESNIGKKMSEEVRIERSNINKRILHERPDLLEKLRTSNIHKWIVTSPDGNSFEISNMKQFCRENNLTAGSMTLVSQSKLNHHKGWKCEKIS